MKQSNVNFPLGRGGGPEMYRNEETRGHHFLSRHKPLEWTERSSSPMILFVGQKVRKGTGTCLYFSLNIFAEFFLKIFPNADEFGPFPRCM